MAELLRRQTPIMPPPSDEAKYLYMKVTGNEPASPAVLAPKLGPLGISPKKVGDDIKAATKDWPGIKVMVKVTIQNRQASAEVLPSSAALILKALGAFRDRKKMKNVTHDGNITMEQLLEVARVMRPSSMARDFSGTVKEILGTCFSIGCTVDDQHPKDVQAKIDSRAIVVGDA